MQKDYEPVGDEVFLAGVDPIVIKDLNGVILDVNPAAERAYGWRREVCVGQNIEALLPDLRTDQLAELIEQVKAGQTVEDVPALRRTKEGQALAVLLSISLLRDDQGRPTAVATVARDGRYAFLFSSTPVPLWEEDWTRVKECVDTLRAQGVEDLATHFQAAPGDLRQCLGGAQLLRSNEAARRLFEVEERLVGNLGKWIEEASLKVLAGTIGELARGAKHARAEIRVITAGGVPKDVVLHLRLNPESHDALRSVLISLIDVTQVREAQREIRDEKAEMRALLETLGDGVISIDRYGVIESVNHAAEEIFGYSAEELLGQNVELLMPEQEAVRHGDYLRAYIEGGEPKIIGIGREVTGRRKDGSYFPMELGVGDSSDGERRRFTGIVRDLTARKSLELEFLQAQKLEAVGRLAGGIAHDFNNLLTGLLVGCRLIAKEMDPDDPTSKMLVDLQSEAMRGVGLTRQLLDFSRSGDLEITALDLNQVLSESKGLLQRLLGEDISLEIQLPLTGGTIAANRGQFDQVLMNLIVNSRDAMPSGGSLRIELAEEQLDASRYAMLEAGRYVVLSVTDTGVGMDEETKHRAFDPFFTTKPEGKGTGLGLSTVFGLVRGHAGHVEIHSELGRGTKVMLYFPAGEEPARQDEGAEEESCAPGQGTILLVEDEALVRKGMQLLLEGQGYDLLVAKDPLEALEVLRREEQGIDLLLTDMVMPHMTGSELAVEARALRPGLRILFTSAFTAAVLVEQGRLEPGDLLLEKPFTEERLNQMVSDALRSAPEPPQ